MRYVVGPALLALFVAAGACAPADADDTGRTYEGIAALVRDQQEQGFVRLGLFGDGWPAKVVHVRTQPNEIEFALKTGARHGYPGYDGFLLKVVRLEGKGGAEIVAVFRSAEKAAAE
jgi:hypothetical protein